jgi:plasmid stability protein
MTRLMIALEEDLLDRAQSRASRQGTSLEALLRSYLAAYADGEEKQAQAVQALLGLSRTAKSGSGGKQWTRDELHDR